MKHLLLDRKPPRGNKLMNLVEYCKRCVCNRMSECSVKDNCPVWNKLGVVPMPLIRRF